MQIKHINMPLSEDKVYAYKMAALKNNLGLYKWIEKTLDAGAGVSGSEGVQTQGQPMYFPPPPPTFPEEELVPYNPFTPMRKSEIQKYMERAMVTEYVAKLHPAFYNKNDNLIDPVLFVGMSVEDIFNEKDLLKRADMQMEEQFRLLAFRSARDWMDKLVLNPHLAPVPEKREQEKQDAIVVARTLYNYFESRNAQLNEGCSVTKIEDEDLNTDDLSEEDRKRLTEQFAGMPSGMQIPDFGKDVNEAIAKHKANQFNFSAGEGNL